MQFRIILLFFIAHLLCDFVYQNKTILNMRFNTTGNIKFSYALKRFSLANFLHSLIHFLTMTAILLIYSFLYGNINVVHYVLISFNIAFFHYIIDEIKSLWIYFKPSFQDNIHLFLMDQLCHFTAIVFLSCNFDVKVLWKEVRILFKNYPRGLSILDRWLILIIVFLICTFAAGIFIKKFINYNDFKDYNKIVDKGFIIKKCKEGNLGARNGGFIIGILERTFILIVMAIGQPSMIGFALTAKSIARFKKLDDSSFAEYFIIGTFISFIFAIVGGIIIKTLNIIPTIK